MHVCTRVVRVNGLGLTLRVSVTPIMKFIYTPFKCKKNLYNFNGLAKQCKYVTI
jgi:hypothetical protein